MTQPASFSHQGRTLFILALIAAACFSTAYTQSTEFNYQGRLANPPGTPANGTYDFQFTLTDAPNGGSVIAVVPRLNVTVSNGVFNTSIDFGSTPFDGSNRYLEIAVRPAGAGGFTTLLPRQQILSTPYAIKSLNADNAAKLAGVDSTRYVQQDAGGNVSIGGGLTVAGSLSLNTVNAQTEYDLGGQRVLSIVNGSSGNPSLSLGTGAGDPNTSPFSTFLGQFAGPRNTGFANTFVGSQSGNANTTGSGKWDPLESTCRHASLSIL